MFGSSRIGLRHLAALCRRLGTGVSAGVDARRLWQREAQSGPRTQRVRLQQVSRAVDRGESISDALKETEGYFPVLFHEMLAVGERSGRLDRVLFRLAEHYEELLRLRGIFLAGIAWPALQLTLAIIIVGLLILVMGWVADYTGQPADILGFGLIGVRGLIVYLLILLMIAAAAWALFRSITGGRLAEPALHLVLRIPGLGGALQIMALARMAWTLALTSDAGMDAHHAMRLALRSTKNPIYWRHARQIEQSLRSGMEMHEALRRTGAFPHDFLDALEAGEVSGRLSESMQALSQSFHERAKAASTTLAVVASIGVWITVAALLIFMIFRVFGFYLNILQEYAQ